MRVHSPPQGDRKIELEELQIGENRLNGTVTLPPALRSLGINFNRLDPDLPDAVLEQCFDSAVCFGLPPFGCSAFGDERRASASGAWDQCVECPSEADGQYTLRTVGPLAGVVLAGALAAAVYVWAVQKYTDFKGWIATSSIILTYVATEAIQLCHDQNGLLSSCLRKGLCQLWAALDAAAFHFREFTDQRVAFAFKQRCDGQLLGFHPVAVCALAVGADAVIGNGIHEA